MCPSPESPHVDNNCVSCMSVYVLKVKCLPATHTAPNASPTAQSSLSLGPPKVYVTDLDHPHEPL